VHRHWSLSHRFLVTIFTAALISPLALPQAAHAQTAAYCQVSDDAVSQKNSLLQAALQGDGDAQDRYKAVVRQHAEQMRRCRGQNWPQNQAIWLRLYPCDAKPGALEALMDKLVNLGYNQVYVEVFYNGQVLLPAAENQTPWPSILRTAGYENKDLLAEAIARGRERGLKVYAWMFTMNFGYSYAQRSTTQGALARNGYGQTSLEFRTAAGLNVDVGGADSEEVFVDPYNLQAKRDYYHLVEAVTRRRPDGVLFDYVRYPRGVGAASISSRVQDLWIYGEAAQQALYQRALNQSGQELIRRFISWGYITVADIQDITKLYPQDGEPLWQGRVPVVSLRAATPEQVQPYLQTELWQLGVAHAIQGILDFLALAVYPAQQQRIPTGAVFFPEGNQSIGQGYDSRLQPWDRFPSNVEWHPMVYGTCGNASCIVSQVQRVMAQAPPGTQVKPVLAGVWGQPISNRPSLEAQMQSIRQVVPQINSVSHFAYSWQEPQADRERKFCQPR
jgi:hypothetical protein